MDRPPHRRREEGTVLIPIERVLAGAIIVTATLLGGVTSAAAQAKPPEPPPVRVGGEIKPPAVVKNSKPAYPAMARAAHVQGVVILEVTIGTNGKVTNTKVVKGVDMLNEAATMAAKAREYKPTLVNGTAVPVLMTLPFVFTLDQ
jgi:protein TonB